MKTNFLLLSLALAVVAPGLGQAAGADQSHVKYVLDARVERFDVSDAILRDAISELSLKDIDNLHVGFEEIIRDKIQDDPRDINPHFSLHLQGKSLREILDELCRNDSRYTWARDGATVNVYPRSAENDPSYLLTLRIDKIALYDAPDPDQALTPLSRRFPTQQVGYFGAGLGNNIYSKPWTTAFENLSVRQFANRVAEHMGSRTSWVWEGGQGERMFTFLKGGFHTGK